MVFGHVVQFPVQVLIDDLGHLYCVSTILVDAVTWIGAVRRKRRYAVLIHRGQAHLRRPLSEFGDWHAGVVAPIDGSTLFTQHLPPEKLSQPAAQSHTDKRSGALGTARNLWSIFHNTLTHGHGELSKVTLRYHHTRMRICFV